MKKTLLSFLTLCVFSLLSGFLYRRNFGKLSIRKANQSVTTARLETTQLDEELQELLELTEWPLSPDNISLAFSTHPKTSVFSLLHPRSTYVVGEQLEVLIIAKDHKGRAKSYGGDFFNARLHSPSLKAGVSGTVTDHYNGSYTASFILQWPGETMVSIKLIHSSEAIAILHEKSTSRPDKVYFKGHFVRNGSEELVECNFNLPGQDVCEYYDARNEEKWVCQKPRNLPCDAYRDHLSGDHREILSAREREFFSMSLIEQEISSNVKSFNVLSQKELATAKKPCVPGLKNPNPSGFYYNDTWISLVCSKQEFDISTKVANCLSGKMIYMFGDSTLRQWWEYLVQFVPTLKQIDLHVTHNPGPLLAMDSDYNYLVQWRAHQKPLRMERIGVNELHYIATELDLLGARKGMVILLNCWAHFVTYPIEVYVNRLRPIRDAVTKLLERSPDTKILIKSANTGYKFSYVSDWLSYQLDTVMRAMFSELPVTILDVWQMTSCHRLPENLHPEKIIIKN
ncbi:NXPE family member 3-like [Engystomops pustulosus]|uniref:NXPE family member 3-like n=1 Tax=Engystomops pustulosus TaxID=76066 RepID=UPI003AFAC406